jgi:cell division protease FtsH
MTTGASDDLKRVADISRSMVYEYAMGTGLASHTMDGGELSDMTRRIRDQEQRDLADEAYRAAYELVRSHRDKLEQLAQHLLVHEVLGRDEIERIMAGVPRASDRRTAGELRLAAATEPRADEQ